MTITKFKQEDKLLTFILILNLLILFILFCPKITSAESVPEDISLNNYQTLELTTGVKVVGLIILLILILLIWEPFSAGLISLFIPISLVVLKSWTNVSTEEALSGFSNKATITVMSMFVLGKGIQNSGAVQFVGKKIENITGDNVKKQIGVISWITGSIASIINNTPVVAAFIPMVTNIAHRTRVSPSKLLIPLSYAAMLGGTITLFGTSTNILASQISERLIDHPFSMFEFSKLGLIVLTTGTLYLITFGYYLLPDRIIPRDDIIKEYQLQDYLVEIEILSDSILIGKNVEDIISENKKDIDIIKIIRDKEEFMQPLKIKTIRKGDHLIISAKPNKLMKFKKNKEIKLLKEKKITQDRLEYPEKGQEVIEIVVSNDSFIENQTIDEVNFLERYNTSLLAIRHGEELIYERLFDTPLKAGDVLLLLVNKTTLERLKKNINLIIEERRIENNFDIPKILLAFGIIGSVIFLASLKIISIAIAALGGVVAMIVTGVVESHK
ncbi:MAG: SLC13 family permease, partial [Halanaerobiaceae bacterium]